MEDDVAFEKFGIPFTESHSINLVTKENVLNAIKILLNNGYKLLGFDAFILTEKTIQPSMEYSKDYTSELYGKNYVPTTSELQIFFSNLPNEITHFEIVFDYKNSK